MCGVCELDDEADVDEGSTTLEFVCGIDDAEDSDDELVTTEYKSLRDVHGWQRRDPWGGSAESRPKRATISSTPITTMPTLSSTSLLLYISATPIVTSATSALIGSREVPLLLMMVGEQKTKSF